MSDRVLFAVMAALVGAAIVVGLISVGGPGQARLEKEDADLLQDLRAMARRLRCDDDQGVLPDSYRPSDNVFVCDGQERFMPLLHRDRPEVPVTYHRDSDVSFRLCAEFHGTFLTNARVFRRDDFDPETGCLYGTIR